MKCRAAKTDLAMFWQGQKRDVGGLRSRDWPKEKIGLCRSQGFRPGWLEPLHCGAGYNMGSPGQGQDELSPANLIRAY